MDTILPPVRESTVKIGLISLIIPVHNDQELLLVLLEKVLTQTLKPFEVVIVDSSDSPFELDESTRESFSRFNIHLRYIHSEPLHPGAARNLGVQQSPGGLIALLDVKTIPPSDWLEEMYRILEETGSPGVYGGTVYLANSQLDKRIRAAVYGVLPIATIPGSLFKREVFSIVGAFLPSVVAGEDTDWMLRARLHGLVLPLSSGVHVTYSGLVGMRFSHLIRKWLRNYRACSDIPYLSDHKAAYLMLFNLFVIFLALNWNAAFAHWDESSTFYVSHITKLTVASIFFLHIGYRGFYLPIRRGIPLSFLLPWEWIFVFLIGLSIDIVKVVAFFPSIRVMVQRVRFALLREVVTEVARRDRTGR